MSKVTLSAIAKKASLSIASVSRVLRTPSITSAQTQSRVYQAIEELNIDASNRITAQTTEIKSNKILILDNQLISKSLINFGLESLLQKENYQLEYLRFSYYGKADIYHLVQYITQHAFAGIIIINDAPYLENLYPFKKALPPIIFINHFVRDFSCVYFDHLMIGYQLTQYLINHYHKKIAILVNDKNKFNTSLLLQGYQQALYRGNISFDPNYLIQDCFTYEHGRLAIKSLLNSTNPPTAIICDDMLSLNYLDKKYIHNQNYLSNYRAVFGALHQAKESQSQLAKPLTITYISHFKELQYNELDTLSRINKPLLKMGEKAALLMCETIKKNIASPQQCHIIDTEKIFIH
ncbi:LacI family DNA-binding transcriptional regulator [uncultured Gilliamella sp.]|uniref:LacI family DNA-binding transcriptional regulator n=1 Tax=uncultured Gilliamella sp. TaxID=1193505 RepID=UPI0025D7FD1D|nr:LacI family DNA-binding transcriptional regulator [uncultured Gilliamella sp.]